VVCSHGELIGAALKRLLGPDLDPGGELVWPKGSTWVLEGAAVGSSMAGICRRFVSKTPRPATTR
jgi:hypothetical protein